MRHIGREMNVTTVFTAINVRTGAAVSFRAGTPLQPILPAVTRDGAAVRECQCFLQRYIDALAGAGFTLVPNAGEREHRRNAARHLVSEMTWRRALPFGVIALTEKKTTGRIGDGIAAFVMAIGTCASEGVSETITKCENSSLKRWLSKPNFSRYPSGVASTKRFADASSLAKISRSDSWFRSRTMLRLFVLA